MKLLLDFNNHALVECVEDVTEENGVSLVLLKTPTGSCTLREIWTNQDNTKSVCVAMNLKWKTSIVIATLIGNGVDVFCKEGWD